MGNIDFWESVNKIIKDGFSSEGLKTLDYYADLFKSGKLLFKRFSPQEQYGCTAEGPSNVIASILAGAEIKTNPGDEELSDFKRELKQGAQQAERIESYLCN